VTARRLRRLPPGSKPEVLFGEAKVDDLLRAAIARNANVLFEAEWPENFQVERQGAADVADAEVDVLDYARWYSTG
jgi:hypothetical protein